MLFLISLLIGLVLGCVIGGVVLLLARGFSSALHIQDAPEAQPLKPTAPHWT